MSIIKLKRSETAAVSPTGLSYGEVAINITDKKIFIGNSAGATVLLVDGNATGGGGSIGDFVFSARSITSSTAGDISIATLSGQQWTFSTSGSLTLPTGGYVVGLQIGIDVQRYDRTLAAIAGLSPDADDLIYFNGTDGASITTLTSFGRSLIDDVSATTARTTLGLTIGTNVQAWDADLDAIAALNGSTGVLKKTGSNAWSIDTDTYWKNTNDGASSGLDTDLIHGVSGKRFMENLQTGILYGGIITVNAGNPATVDITAGAGIVVTPGASLTAMPAPVVTNVTWAAQTAVALPQIANYDETWISFNSSGVVTLKNVGWTDAQYASEIPIGAVYHVNRSSVNLVKNYPHVAYGQAEQMDPFIRAFGPLKLSGHEISANGANLSVNRTSGKSYAIGRNYQTDPNNPNIVTDTNALPASVVWRFYRNGGTGFTTVINSVIDPSNYDDGSGTLQPTTKWTIQRIFFLPNQTNTLGVYYGTVEYTALVDAQLALLTETFTESESTATQGVFLGYLIVKGNTTDLSDTAKAKFIQGGLFRNVSGGGGAGLAVTSIDDLTDVTIVSAASNDLLRWNGSQWVNSTIGSLGISTLTGIETLTNKTLTSPTISNLYLSDGLILVEGTTNDSNEMSLVVSSLTADRTITFPNATGSVITTGNLTSITSTGTIASGTWQGTAIADSYISSATTWNTAYTDRNKWDGGATGLTAATGRTSLGLDIGTNVQAYNSTLAAVAGGTYTGTNTITTLGTIGTGTWQGTAIGDTYISSATTWNTASTDRFKWDGGATGLVAATGRTSLGLAIGSDVQGYNVTLAAVSAGTYTGSTSITTLGTVGTGTWQGTAIGDTYISSATTWNTASTDRFKWDGGATGLVAATGRTSLGLGSVENTAISTWAGSTNITTLGTIATGVWSGTAIGATKGGTGQTTYAVGDLLYSATTNTLTVLAKPAATAFLQMTSAGVPSWQTSISTSYLSSSSITVNGTSISLGSSGTVTATATNALTISTGLTGTSYNGSTAVTIAVDTSVIATKSYVDSLASGLHQHHNADAGTTSKLATLTGVAVSYSSGTQAITWTAGTAATAAGFTDGTTLTANTTETSASHILLKNEGDVGGLGSAYNGTYYVYGARELRRASDGNVAGDWAGGDFIFVLAGTSYNNTGWVQTEKITTLDTDAILFEQFSGAGTYTADESSLTKTGSVFSIKSTYVGQTSITTLGTVGTGTWSATAIGATKGGTGQTTYAVGDLIYSSATDVLSKLAKPGATSVLSMTSAGVPSWNAITGTGSVVFGTSPSITTLEISTTSAGPSKTAAINMATGVTGVSVNSVIQLNGYENATPATFYGVIASGSSYGDIFIGSTGDSYIGIIGNTVSLGDVSGTNGGGVITIDTPDSGFITLAATEIRIVTTTPEVGKVLTCLDTNGAASWETLTFSEPTSSPSISAGTLVLDLSVSRVFTVSLNASVTTLTISNTPATASMSQNFSLILTADGTARTITWPASVKWANNDAPSLTSTNAKKDILSFISTDAGTTWYGFIGGLNF